MCFSCDDCGYYIANALYIWERLVSCCAMTAIICCLIATLLIMLGMGVGVGYNYCFVDNKMSKVLADTKDIDPADVPIIPTTLDYTDTDSTTPVFRFRRDLLHKGRFNYTDSTEFDYNSIQMEKSDVTMSPIAVTVGYSYEIKPTMVVPLRYPKLLSIVKRLVENNKNVTLELIQ